MSFLCGPYSALKGDMNLVMSSLCVPLFKLRGDVENRGIIFIYCHMQPYIELGIYTPTLIFTHHFSPWPHVQPKGGCGKRCKLHFWP
jgi:hypothetical protein